MISGGGRWRGDEWRWYLGGVGKTTISVIDRSQEDEEKAQKREGKKVPFGFSREIPQPEPDPLLWEGD